MPYDGADRVRGWTMWVDVGATHWVAPTDIMNAGREICGVLAFVSDNQNTVHMIRHDNPFIQLDIWKMNRNVQPAFFYDGANMFIFEKQRFLMGAYGHEIRAFLRIIVVLQAKGTALVLLRRVYQF